MIEREVVVDVVKAEENKYRFVIDDFPDKQSYNAECCMTLIITRCGYINNISRRIVLGECRDLPDFIRKNLREVVNSHNSLIGIVDCENVRI